MVSKVGECSIADFVGGNAMSLGVQEILDWDSDALSQLAGALDTRGTTMSELKDDVETIGRFEDWTGQGADGAKITVSQIGTSLVDRAAAAAALSQLVDELSETVSTLKGDLKTYLSDARTAQFSVSDNGSVSDTKPDVDEEEKADRERKRADLEADIKGIIRLADDAEDDTERILDTVISGDIPGLDDADSPEEASDIAEQWADDEFAPPGLPDDVEQQQSHWDSLPESTKDYLLESHPELLVNAYGLDPKVRDQAGKNYIPKLREDLEERRGEAQGPSARYPQGSPERVLLDEKLEDLKKIEEVAGAEGSDAHILGLRENDDGVGVVIANGDISEADNIAIHTPGMTTTTRGSLNGQSEMGRRLVDEMDRVSDLSAGESKTNAVVSYMNMDFPQSVGQAASGDWANEAAPDLANVIDGTSAAAPENARVTAIGHSYGSVTTSEALQENTSADAAVFYGSPGIETGDDDHDFSVSDLGVPKGHVYSMQTENDPIVWAQGTTFGPGPTTIDGIERVEIDPDYLDRDSDLYSDRGLAEGHSGYHRQDEDNGQETAAFSNLAAIATNETEGLEPYDSETRVEEIKTRMPYGGYGAVPVF